MTGAHLPVLTPLRRKSALSRRPSVRIVGTSAPLYTNIPHLNRTSGPKLKCCCWRDARRAHRQLGMSTTTTLDISCSLCHCRSLFSGCCASPIPVICTFHLPILSICSKNQTTNFNGTPWSQVNSSKRQFHIEEGSINRWPSSPLPPGGVQLQGDQRAHARRQMVGWFLGMAPMARTVLRKGRRA